MSRVGKKPVLLPPGTQVEIQGRTIVVKGPKGVLSQSIPEGIEVSLDNNTALVFTRNSDKPKVRALHGLVRMLAQNMVTGVSEGFVKRLELRGTGYRASVSGRKLILTVGFSRPVELEFPEDITVKVEGTTTKENLPTTILSVSGIDKQKVGHYASLIRRVRPAEPYKGKGIRYEGEYVRRKAGKTG